VPTGRADPVQLRPAADRGIGGEPGLDGAHRPAVHGVPVLRQSADRGVAEAERPPGEPQAGAATAADHGAGSPVSRAESVADRPMSPDPLVSAPRGGDGAGESGVVGRYHVHPVLSGFLSVVAAINWFSRFVVGWRLSNTLDGAFCRDMLDEALATGTPEVFNTDQGVQVTATGWVERVQASGAKVRVDGRGRCRDNVFVERLRRSVKYEDVYPRGYESVPELERGCGRTSASTTRSGCTSRSATAPPPRCTARAERRKAKSWREEENSSDPSPIFGLDNGVHCTVRVHRSVLQPDPPTLVAGVRCPGGVRIYRMSLYPARQ